MTGPTIGKRRLRAELRRTRLDRGLTQDTVANAMDWSLSKLIRIENGTVAISVSDLRSLLSYYGVHNRDQIDALVQLARAARTKMWWDEYRVDLALSVSTLTYVGFEAEATEIKCYHPIMLPDLLQTEAYSRALLTGFDPDADSKDIDRRVEFRLRRQREVLERDDPPRLLAVLDESVLLRSPDGSPETMRAQLAALVQLVRARRLAVRVIRLNAGAHKGWDGSFTVLEFGDDDQVLYAENNPTGEVVLWEEQGIVDEFRAELDRMESMAISADESVRLIETVAQQYR